MSQNQQIDNEPSRLPPSLTRIFLGQTFDALIIILVMLPLAVVIPIMVDRTWPSVSQGTLGVIAFLSPSGDGMVADIAAFRPNEYISLRHLGWIVNGVEDTESEAVRAWAPAFENYTFQSVPEGTRPIVDQDVLEVTPRAMPRECPPPPAARAAGAIPAIPGSRPRRG